jgi:hypothetical protein
MSREYHSNNMLCFLLTASGLNTAPVISPVGTITTTAQGSLKFSPDGKKIGQTAFNGTPAVTIYDFDNSTGIVSNPNILAVNLGSYGSYGSDFSADSKKYYASTYYAYNTSPAYISQWDLCAGNNAAIAASQFTIQATGVGNMQLAIDGKIYVSKGYANRMGIISSPALPGYQCQYNDTIINFDSVLTSYALPNFVSSYHDKKSTASVIINMLTSCQNVTVTPYLTTCGLTGEIPTINWDFGDIPSGSNNASSLSTAVHSFSSPGTYTITLNLSYKCYNDKIKKVVTVSACTNVDEIGSTQNYKIFPNPADDKIEIMTLENAENLNYKIKDMLGRIASEGIVTEGNKSIPVRQLAQGIYLVELSNSHFYFDDKLIIRH